MMGVSQEDDQPLVSVIVPTFNSADYLYRTLQTVLNQTWENWEILVVDGGSGDRSAEIAEEFLIENSLQGRVIRTEDLGGAYSRNTGVAHANGEFLAFLDADDLWFPDKLDRQVGALRSDPSALGCTTDFLFQRGSRTFRNPQPFLWSMRHVMKWLEMETYGPCLNSTLFVRRAVLLDLGCYDSDLWYAEDLDLGVRLSRTGRMLRIPEVLMAYQIHDRQISSNTDLMESSMESIFRRHLWANPAIQTRARANLYAMIALRKISLGQILESWKFLRKSWRLQTWSFFRMAGIVSLRRSRRHF